MYIKASLTNHTAWFLAFPCSTVGTLMQWSLILSWIYFVWVELSNMYTLHGLPRTKHQSQHIPMGINVIFFLYPTACSHTSYCKLRISENSEVPLPFGNGKFLRERDIHGEVIMQTLFSQQTGLRKNLSKEKFQRCILFWNKECMRPFSTLPHDFCQNTPLVYTLKTFSSQSNTTV